MRIDSHLHLWVNDPENYPWNPIGGYIPQEDASLTRYLKVMEKHEVDRAVLVQPTPYGWDNAYLLDCKKRDPEKFRAVVLVDPLSESAQEKFRELVEEGADGLRINMQLLPLGQWRNELFYALLNLCADLQMPICLQATPEYLGLIKEMAEAVSTPFIIDHLGRPEPGSAPDAPEFKRLLNLSEHANVYVKLSGMNYYSKETAPYRDTWPLLRAVKDQFGPERCMWGSDFPFVEDHWTYAENMALFAGELGFNNAEIEWIFGKTASSIWWNGSSG